jgi:hypothetical protein
MTTNAGAAAEAVIAITAHIELGKVKSAHHKYHSIISAIAQ